MAEKLDYCNIVSPDIVSYLRYLVIARYATLDEALSHYEKDVLEWKEKNRSTAWYKFNYPFAYATIKEG